MFQYTNIYKVSQNVENFPRIGTLYANFINLKIVVIEWFEIEFLIQHFLPDFISLSTTILQLEVLRLSVLCSNSFWGKNVLSSSSIFNKTRMSVCLSCGPFESTKEFIARRGLIIATYLDMYRKIGTSKPVFLNLIQFFF